MRKGEVRVSRVSGTRAVAPRSICFAAATFTPRQTARQESYPKDRSREVSMFRAKRMATALTFAACLVWVAGLPSLAQSQTTATVFEGARLIPGDGGGPIENSALVMEGNRIPAVGRRGEVTAPSGAAHVDLTG